MQASRDTRCHFCNAPIKAGDEARDCNRMTVQITAETREEAEANSLLIRSAPDLLAALECQQALDMATDRGYAILERHGWDRSRRFELQASEFVKRMTAAAIAKATGGAA